MLISYCEKGMIGKYTNCVQIERSGQVHGNSIFAHIKRYSLPFPSNVVGVAQIVTDSKRNSNNNALLSFESLIGLF